MKTDCIEWQRRKNVNGYGMIWDRTKKRFVRAHRSAWEEHRGPIPEGMCVLHKCDNPPCINIDHLFLGTQADNMRDMDRKGRRGSYDRSGGANPKAVLTWDKVRRMRSLHEKNGISAYKLAPMFGCNQSTAERVIAGRTWKEPAK